MKHYTANEMAAQIKANNKANKIAGEVYEVLAAFFTPLVGKKIIKVDGSLMGKIKAELPALDFGAGVTVVRDSRNGSNLVWTVQVCEKVQTPAGWRDAGSVYGSATVYVGSMPADVLTEMAKPVTRRTDLAIEEVNTLLADYEAKKKIADQAESALYGTGLY